MPSGNSYYSPPHTAEHPSTRQGNSKKRRIRREYALGEFDFESNTPRSEDSIDMLAAYGLTTDGKVDASADIQKRAVRFYGDQTLVPHGSVSPCINATDRARRARHTCIREPEEQRDMPITKTSTYCDITPLLSEPQNSRSVALGAEDSEGIWTDDGLLEDDEIPDIPLTDDGDDPGQEFELVKYEPMSEHNGTVRRWYRGFRH